MTLAEGDARLASLTARWWLVRLFLAFAIANSLSALLRAVPATLAPVFSLELGLSAADLGLLSGAYFLGFAVVQLPLGSALDRWGPRKVQQALLSLAVLACLAFSQAATLPGLLWARVLMGVGMSACLMAGLTAFSHLLPAAAQLRASAWMLMTGSLGMLASTLPVQWLLPLTGWRGLFIGLAGALLLSLWLISRWVPRALGQGLTAPDGSMPKRAVTPTGPALADRAGYRTIAKHPAFRAMAPLAFFAYGGLLAMQSLWIGPWLTQVAGQSAASAAAGLFVVNLSMLITFLCWGWVMPHLVRRGYDGQRVIAVGWPVGIVILAVNLWLGPGAGAWHWAAWCMATSVVTLSQPALGQAFAPALAGRALSAFNMLIFAGVFTLQWGMGLLIDGLQRHGVAPADAVRLSVAMLGLGVLFAFCWFVRARKVAGTR